MMRFKEIVVIYPDDPSIDFLKPIVDKLSRLLPNCKIERPGFGDNIKNINDKTELVIFLGHGTSRELFAGCRSEKEKTVLCNVNTGALLFDNCSVILLSCNSKEYLKNMQFNPVSIDTFIVFGDLPTDWEHIKHNRVININFWEDCTNEQLEFYKSTIVESFSYGSEKAVKTDSFYGLSKGINYIIHKKINLIINEKSLSKKQKLQLIERMVEFKKEMIYADSL